MSSAKGATASATMTNELAEQIGQEIRRKYGSIGRACKTLRSDHRGGIPRAEVRKFLGSCGYSSGVADRFFDSFDYASDGVISHKNLQEKLSLRRNSPTDPITKGDHTDSVGAARAVSQPPLRGSQRSPRSSSQPSPRNSDNSAQLNETTSTPRLEMQSNGEESPWMEETMPSRRPIHDGTIVVKSEPPLSAHPLGKAGYGQFHNDCQKIGAAAMSKHKCATRALRRVIKSPDNRVSRKEVQRFYKGYGYGQDEANRFFDYLDEDNQRNGVPFDQFRAHFAPHIEPYNEVYKKEAEKLVTPRYLHSEKRSGTPRCDEEKLSRLPGDLPAVIDAISLNASKKHTNVWQATRCLTPSVEGSITQTQVRSFFRNYGYPSEQLADKFYNELDHVADGSVSINEFQKYFTRSFENHHGCDRFEGLSEAKTSYVAANRDLAYDKIV
eukprot:TRINITY_DN63918_c0_g1_i1.p1 TRINITY_DN63918_c0_g1~~TRINITY_DN63918_c0_g1_i1.p1  ORF type:complete len:440 (-),score=48.43 TRINITY_DN63918_c0_g1_i1:43-1362(-)